MPQQYEWKENYPACRMQLDLRSFVRFSVLVGFSAAVGLIPVMLFLIANNPETQQLEWGSILVSLIFLMPLAGVFNGVITGLIAYPLYSFISTRMKGQSYTGIFVGLEKKADGDPPELH